MIVSGGNGYYFGENHIYKLCKRYIMKNNLACYMILFKRTEHKQPMMVLETGLNRFLIDKTTSAGDWHYKCVINEFLKKYRNISENIKAFDEHYLNRNGLSKVDESRTGINPPCGHESHSLLNY